MTYWNFGTFFQFASKKDTLKKKQWKFPALKKFGCSNNCFAARNMKRNRRRSGCQPVKFSTISHNNMQARLYPWFSATVTAVAWLEFETPPVSVKWHLPLVWAAEAAHPRNCARPRVAWGDTVVNAELGNYTSHDSKWSWLWRIYNAYDATFFIVLCKFIESYFG